MTHPTHPYDELVQTYPGLHVSWSDSPFGEWDHSPSGETEDGPYSVYGPGARAYRVWDKTRYDADVATYWAKVHEVEDWAPGAKTQVFTAPNGMTGKVLFVSKSKEYPRGLKFYPREYPPNWVDYVVIEEVTS